MASIKVKFKPSGNADYEGIIYYQVDHDRKARQIMSDYKVFSHEWDAKRSMVTTTCTSKRKTHILAIRNRIRRDVERLVRVDRQLDASGFVYSVDDVVDEYTRYARECTLSEYMRKIIRELKDNGRIRTSETYTSTLSSFMKFESSRKSEEGGLFEEEVTLDSITPELMEAYDAWLRQRGIVPNTRSFYFRILRAVYNRAVRNGITADRRPFMTVYTGVDKTIKRALPLPMIRKIKSLDLRNRPSLEFARDMFMMSFYLRGMSLIDMAFLTKKDMKKGYVVYRRHKTGQQLVVKWTEEMQTLLDKYPDTRTDLLLPIISQQVKDQRTAYRSMNYKINRGLKTIGEMIGAGIPLTLYVARHSWASAARQKGVPISVISEGMGHDSEQTTRIYLASLDTAAVDRANALILRSL